METKRSKRSIIYARVSTVIQETDRQVVDLLAYAKGNGYGVERIYTEKISGAKKNSERPALMDDLRKKLSGRKAKRYRNASLARRHNVNVSTVQSAAKMLIGNTG